MQTNIDQLRSFLVAGGYISPVEFDDANNTAQTEGQEITDVLIERGFFNEDLLVKSLSDYFGVPHIDIRQAEIDQDVLLSIPEQIAREHQAVAIKREKDALIVAMKDPGDLEAIQLLEKSSGMKVVPYIATPSGIRSALARYQAGIAEEFDQILKTSVEQTAKLKGEATDIAGDLSVVTIFDTLVKHAVSLRASDIHIEPQEKNLVVRYRIDGVLKTISRLPLFVHAPIVARIKILAALRVDEKMSPQDGRFKVELAEAKVAVRVSIMPTFHGEKAVLRLLEEGSRFYNLEELGFSTEMAKLLMHEIGKPHGMVLLTGPTGAGKTTTLYTILHIRNKPEVNIETVEDPIEYDIAGISQTQVNETAKMTFAEGLRSILRQSPDIIMVGEIRDAETAELTIHAALTGHLVLSTLHTNDAVGAIPRLIDMGIESFLLGSTLNVSIAQRLVRKICSSCTKSVKITIEELETIKKQLLLSDPHLDLTTFPTGFYQGSGCKVCNGTGYTGRIGLFELLVVDETIRTMIASKTSTPEIVKYAREHGSRSIIEDGLDKVSAGVTTFDEIIKALEE